MNLVITHSEDNELCKCQFCDTIIAKIISDLLIPTAEECYTQGNVPIPNFGWFCSQECAHKYEEKYNVKFKRTSEGKIDYYKK